MFGLNSILEMMLKKTIEPINSDKTINKNYSVSILNKIDLTFNNEENL
jgi:hypothetical protein